MCGIYGYIGKPKDKSKVFRLMKTLAVLTETRGIDGTGFFALTDSELITEKCDIRAKEFIRVSKLMKRAIVDENAEVFVGHNRKASLGAINLRNTHPFVGDRYAMVHNGTFGETAFKLAGKHRVKCKMEGETDSEAMLRVFDKIGFSAKTLKKLDCYSLVILDYTTRQIFFARDNQRPIVIYDLRASLGIRVFASTYDIAEAAFEYLELDFENVFKTKAWHLYTFDIESGEAENLGRYYTPPTSPKPKLVRATNFGRRGYAAPGTEEELTIHNPNRVRRALIVYGD